MQTPNKTWRQKRDDEKLEELLTKIICVMSIVMGLMVIGVIIYQVQMGRI